MGFLKSIGSAISNVAKTVSNVAGKVSNIAGKVADIAGKAVNILKAPEQALSGLIKKAAGGLLDKLPFNLGNIAKPFLDKVVDGALSLISKSNLGSVFEFAKKLAPKVGQLADFAEKVKSAADKVGAFTNKTVGESTTHNLQELFSTAHADALAARYAA
ncbi:MAG TPA: hypothetical protein VF794_12740 [Archangium sp.]|jgi:hypothetical protein|uniref:hypothetical protein n=1 Tax=Archangium sp. TaxID=1872627 RepID=UPI002ED90D70